MKYDVIVIGGGSAGCVLATRLTEDANRSVLLLEAGPEYTSMEQYPDDLKYGYNQTASAVNAPHNWSFLGTPTTQQGDSMPIPTSATTFTGLMVPYRCAAINAIPGYPHRPLSIRLVWRRAFPKTRT